MIAFQMAAKATRDGLFLSSFDVSDLPRMVVTSAVVSVVTALIAARWMTSWGPGRLVQAAFVLSAALLLAEWALVGSYRQAVAIILYLHYGALGAVLVSGFWSVVNERFDPRTAKRYIGRIAAGGTVGGLLGGLLAAGLPSVVTMLPILAGLHLLCAVLVFSVRTPGDQPVAVKREDEPPARSGLKVIAETSYLRGLVALVLLLAVSEVLIDYVFKASVTEEFGGGEQSLTRVFAVFYTGVALLTVVVQALASRPALQHLGLTRTVSLLPLGAALGGIGAIAVPGFPSATIARSMEAVTRNGLYRAGYELLFTPVAPVKKRAAKALVDVGVVRLGDVAGGGLVQLTLLVVAAAAALRTLLGFAVVLSIVAIVLALRLRSGYVRTLEKSLLSRAVQLDLDEVQDAITRTTVLQSAADLGLTKVRASVPAAPDAGAGEVSEAAAELRPSGPRDAEIDRIVELRSRHVSRTRAVLRAGPLTPALVPHAIALLAWDDVLRDAIVALRDAAMEATGQLVDHLVDPSEEFAVRRRIPLVLAACPTERAVDGLLRGLEDPRFEVRYRCGRALSRLLDLNHTLVVDRERAFAAVLREVAVDKGVWESHRVLDQTEDEAWSPVMDEMLRKRANRGLEHVFTVLALVLPRQPLKVAFRGLHTDDQLLRGTALEYLETLLPEKIRRPLWPFLEDTRPHIKERRSADQVLQDLLASNQSIALNLEALRKKPPETDE
jgi:hypothetical protein